jgi:hypothetical protein
MTDGAVDGVLRAPDAPPDAVGTTEAIATERVLPEIEHPIGALRTAILVHLVDSAEASPQSVAQIIAGVGGTISRNSVEAAIHREFKAGRIVRTSPGHYVLAPSKPPAPLEPPPPAAVAVAEMVAGFAWPSDLAGLTEGEWLAALWAWDDDPATWDTRKFGPSPDQPNHRVPLPILAHFKDARRKRQERAREADARAARQREADAKLRDELLAAAHGNYICGPALDDLAPVKAILETVPLDDLRYVIVARVDRRSYPGNMTLTSWRDPIFLKAVAEDFCRRFAKNMVATWSGAGNTPQKPAGASDALPAVQGGAA